MIAKNTIRPQKMLPKKELIESSIYNSNRIDATIPNVIIELSESRGLLSIIDSTNFFIQYNPTTFSNRIFDDRVIVKLHFLNAKLSTNSTAKQTIIIKISTIIKPPVYMKDLFLKLVYIILYNKLCK